MPVPWTSETARKAAALSALSRQARRQRLEALEATLPRAAFNEGSADEWARERLACVRRQLRKADSLFERTTDAHDLGRLVSAICRLSEVERKLAGRPLPGSRRPGRERARPAMPIAEPLGVADSPPDLEIVPAASTAEPPPITGQ